MKKSHLVAYATIALFIFYGCKKSSSTTTSKSSTWKLAGVSYTAKTTTFISPGGIFSELIAYDAAGNTVNVEFSNTSPAAGTYAAVDVPGDTTQCTVSAIIKNAVYASVGKAGDKVTLTISGGKRTITFNNITLVNEFTSSDSTTITGNLIEQ